MSITPLGDRVIVTAGESEEVTASGIVLPDTAKEKPQRGTVVAVGPGRVVDGEDVVVLSEHDILAKLDAPKKAAKGKK